MSIRITIEAEGLDDFFADPRVAGFLANFTVPPVDGDRAPVTYIDEQKEYELQRSRPDAPDQT